MTAQLGHELCALRLSVCSRTPKDIQPPFALASCLVRSMANALLPFCSLDPTHSPTNQPLYYSLERGTLPFSIGGGVVVDRISILSLSLSAKIRGYYLPISLSTLLYSTLL